MTTLFLGGAHYCPSAKRFFQRLLTAQIPFLYLPYRKENQKKQYWQSLSSCLPVGAPETFPAVMLLDEKMEPRQWKQDSEWLSDDAIFQYIQANRPTDFFLRSAECTDRFDTVDEEKTAWEHFQNNKAFIFLGQPDKK